MNMAAKPSYEELEQRISDLETLLHAFILSERSLQESENRYRRITEAVTDYIFTVRIDGGQPLDTVHGPACEAVTGYTAEEFHNDQYLWIRMVPEEDRDIIRDQISRILSNQKPEPIEHRIVRKDGVMRWVRNTAVPNYDRDGNLISYDGLIRDSTDIKEAEGKREELVRAACKKIRNDQGYWQQIEAYIHEHSDAEFSHSICPECFRQLYPDLSPPKNGDKH